MDLELELFKERLTAITEGRDPEKPKVKEIDFEALILEERELEKELELAARILR